MLFKHVASSYVSVMSFTPPPQQLPEASLLDRAQWLFFQACSLYWNGSTSSLSLSRTEQHSVMANCIVQSPRRGCMARSPLLVAISNSVRPHSYWDPVSQSKVRTATSTCPCPHCFWVQTPHSGKLPVLGLPSPTKASHPSHPGPYLWVSSP